MPRLRRFFSGVLWYALFLYLSSPSIVIHRRHPDPEPRVVHDRCPPKRSSTKQTPPETSVLGLPSPRGGPRTPHPRQTPLRRTRPAPNPSTLVSSVWYPGAILRLRLPRSCRRLETRTCQSGFLDPTPFSESTRNPLRPTTLRLVSSLTVSPTSTPTLSPDLPDHRPDLTQTPTPEPLDHPRFPSSDLRPTLDPSTPFDVTLTPVHPVSKGRSRPGLVCETTYRKTGSDTCWTGCGFSTGSIHRCPSLATVGYSELTPASVLLRPRTQSRSTGPRNGTQDRPSPTRQ